jgi:hypothetical protein
MNVISLSFDSFLASMFLGALGVSRRAAILCAFAFGACDGAATLAGALWPVQWSQAVMLCLYVLCAVALCAVRSTRVLLWVLPVALSLDNLLSKTPGALAPLLGAGSTAMSLCGSGVAALIRNRWFASRTAL